MHDAGTCPRTARPSCSAILRWTASIGAVTAEALRASTERRASSSARGTLGRATRERLLHRVTAARRRARAVHGDARRAARGGLIGLDPCRVSAANALHTIACAHAAAALQRRYPDQRVVGERELRREERAAGAPLASAVLRRGGDRGRLLHRPDLVLWPRRATDGAAGRGRGRADDQGAAAPGGDLPRLGSLARRRGVLYLAPPDVERARACARSTGRRRRERVVVLSLDALPLGGAAQHVPVARSVPSRA